MLRDIISHLRNTIGIKLKKVALPVSERLKDPCCNEGKFETKSMDLLTAEDSNQGNFKFLQGCSLYQV